ncbi:hypothetical protein [Streptomyces sp. NBC_00859]|uniref:hypothetical protein n=1 Tax=Streptomyces sp. NBC_00859 TaxID=2903682 RepID=UPI003865072E|nr:hypothetical protein OG584_00075 [Streptomyces sp. NBC_00859]WSZ86781.1 hypothetical protein OG584_35060 [Streptomyces sp. NBC_00859]
MVLQGVGARKDPKLVTLSVLSGTVFLGELNAHPAVACPGCASSGRRSFGIQTVEPADPLLLSLAVGFEVELIPKCGIPAVRRDKLVEIRDPRSGSDDRPRSGGLDALVIDGLPQSERSPRAPGPDAR